MIIFGRTELREGERTRPTRGRGLREQEQREGKGGEGERGRGCLWGGEIAEGRGGLNSANRGGQNSLLMGIKWGREKD